MIRGVKYYKYYYDLTKLLGSNPATITSLRNRASSFAGSDAQEGLRNERSGESDQRQRDREKARACAYFKFWCSTLGAEREGSTAVVL